MAEKTKFEIKILVDEKKNKVVFAEAKKDFVDFIFCIMSLRLSTVSKLLNDNKLGMVGSLGALYRGIAYLAVNYLEPDITHISMLKPSAISIPLLLHNDVQTTILFYKCDKHSNYVCDRCPSCNTGSISSELWLTYIPPKIKCSRAFNAYVHPRYVKGAGTYAVMDNLEVKPMCITLIRSFDKGFDNLVEKNVVLGCQEGLALLKASLEKQAVLTSVFLGEKK